MELLVKEPAALVAAPVNNERFETELLRQALSRPTPMYVEDDVHGVGICCDCARKGVLGRCPKCGLLMHYTCVSPSYHGEGIQCPICKTHSGLQRRAESAQDLPYWHEAELGAPVKREHKRPYSEVGRPPFPSMRWPTTEEARLHGYATIKDWYLDCRAGESQVSEEDRRRHEVEFADLESRLKVLDTPLGD